jgi:5,10-methylenetetrahydromethanopterin reductase
MKPTSEGSGAEAPSGAKAPIRIATGTVVKDYDWYRRWLEVAEASGFDLLSTGDSQSLWADPFITMAVAAEHTTRPRIGVTVSNPQTRHPAVVASSLVALQQVSGGRIVYGLSSGDSALRNIGLRPARLSELEEYARAVKGLCAGQPVTYQGTELSMSWGSAPVPLWMAAEGPRTQYLAGQIADGVVLHTALDAPVFAAAVANITAGAESAGRSVADIEVWCMAAMQLADSEADGIHALRFQLAGIANFAYRFHMEGKAVPEEYQAPLRELQRRYDSGHHVDREGGDAHAALIDELGLTEFIAKRSVIAGPPERCIERIREVAAFGATNLIVSQFVDDQLAFMETFAKEIKPALS